MLSLVLRSLKARSKPASSAGARAIELLGGEAELLHAARLDDQRLESGGDAALLNGGAELVELDRAAKARPARLRAEERARSAGARSR